MTLFEYVSAAHTLLLTFAAARILAGVPSALEPRRLYWVYLSWVCLAIMFCLASFWALWSYREIEWTLPRLVSLLATPALIYVFSAILVPGDSSDIDSWKDYFFAVRLRLFVGGLVMILSIMFSNQLIAGVSSLHRSQFPLYLLLGVFAVGAISDRPRIHNILAFVPPLVIVAVLIVLGRPNWTTQ